MFRAKLSVVCRLTIVGLALLAAACSSTPEDKTGALSPNKIYADAKDEMNAGAYDKAITLPSRGSKGAPLAHRWRSRHSWRRLMPTTALRNPHKRSRPWIGS